METSPSEAATGVVPSGPAFPPSAGGAGSPTHYGFTYHGTGGALFALMLRNILFTILTLGIYTPWARVERRRFIWQNLEIHGHRLRWHGTGKELLIGYLKVIAAYAALIGLPLAARSLVGPTAGLVTQVVLSLGILPLIPVAIYASRRYLLSRTSWRGIRFSMQPGAGAYARKFFGGYLLTLVTLGFYGPIWMNQLYAFVTDRSALGNKSFSYSGSDKEVFKLSMKGLLLTLCTLGVYFFWYQAELSRYQAAHTHFDHAHAELSLTGGELFTLFWLQVFALTLTLGLAFPWVATYSLRFTTDRLRFVGDIDLAHLYQAQSHGDATADGLADALDVGLAL